MKLILHVGTHKTGTTAIQSFLQANTDIIMKHGVCYPLFDVRWPQLVKANRNGYFLNRAALRRLDVEAKVDDGKQVTSCIGKLEKAIAKDCSADILLSDERMWYSGAIHPGYWEAVKNVVRGIGFESIEVIVYFRRQDEFAESLWNQFVKATKMTEDLKSYLKSPRVRALCDYHAGVKRIERVFGRDSVCVAVYDRTKLKNGDVVDDFCYRIGLPLDGGYHPVSHKEANPRLSSNLVELKRIMNNSVEYQGLNNVFGKAFAHAMSADNWSEETPLLDDGTRTEFLAHFKRGNKALANERFAGKALFRSPKPSSASIWEFENEAMLRDAVLVMADLICEQEKRIRLLEAFAQQVSRPHRPGKGGVAMSNPDSSPG